MNEIQPPQKFLGTFKDKHFQDVRPLSEAEADDYLRAAKRLRVYEREMFPFLCLRQNHRELQAALNDYALEENHGLWSSMHGATRVVLHFNRLIMNFLSSTRSFLDHAETRLDRTFGRDSDEFRDFKETTALHYDGRFSYRFVYDLRNYAQHCGLPIGNLRAAVREHPPRSKKAVTTLKVQYSRDQLLSDYDRWKPLVAKEIAAKPPEWDVIEDLDYAMTALTDVQLTVLQGTVPLVVDDALFVRKLRNEVADPDATVFLAHVEQERDGHISLTCNELPVDIADMVLDDIRKIRKE